MADQSSPFSLFSPAFNGLDPFHFAEEFAARLQSPAANPFLSAWRASAENASASPWPDWSKEWAKTGFFTWPLPSPANGLGADGGAGSQPPLAPGETAGFRLGAVPRSPFDRSLFEQGSFGPVTAGLDAFVPQLKLMTQAFQRHTERMAKQMQADGNKASALAAQIADRFQHAQDPAELLQAWSAYVNDTFQRQVLTLDALRQRGDIFLQHEAAGAPPVLIYHYEVILDGAHLPRPCNYILLRILPPEGVTVHDWKRPYVIIDPRAGHGAGIGGFKEDSQVGVALKDGHPVYFVAFKPTPEPGQVLADVTHAEAAFLREIQRRHAEAPKPIVVGNCQGGWATAILAARNPDLAGPIVLNGAPMSYWSGRVGQDPMRYSGGLLGGVLPTLVASDLGGGIFDGADLVLNFESLNPGRTWFKKYYNLYTDVDDGIDRFLEFEKWWGGFYLMNADEIRWIVENLFVGNRLGKNEARLETGRPIDLKAIRAPIIVFASHGDNITPPQQALNWIVDTYTDEREIQIRGQRIIYIIHDQVGHLGIFVSSDVAKREHTQMASTLKTIEALSPGLYEMKIENVEGEGHEKRFTVSFHRRQMGDILAIDDGREEEAAFGAVARLSETVAETYDVALSPMVRQLTNGTAAQMRRAMHPLRLQRSLMASNNPAMGPVASLAEQVRAARAPASPSNPFVLAERLWADSVEAGWNYLRDLRALMNESVFFAAYAHPLALWYGKPRAQLRAHKAPQELRALTEVQLALSRLRMGGLSEAIVRMLVLLADTRGDVRRDRLERSAEVLSTRAPFEGLDALERSEMIHEQTLIAHFEPVLALETLPELLPVKAERTKALEMVDYVLGAEEEMEPGTLATLETMRQTLEVTKPAPKKAAKAQGEKPAAKAQGEKPAAKAQGE